ncbi:MAG: transmembrane 220 family protein [Myxococcota bacterium]|nr:transmembrane 220 family protein [Myxococcota bacterium]
MSPRGRPGVPSWLSSLNVAMSLLFLVFAGVQYNDPDPLLWTSVYAAAAVLSFCAVRSSWALRSSLWAALGAGAWALVLLWMGISANGLPAVLAGEDMSSPGVEELRESGGLLIVACWLMCLDRLVARPSLHGEPSP